MVSTTSPTVPSASVCSETFRPSSPSENMIDVPRMPMVATGVSTVAAPGLLAAMSPLTKAKTPVRAEKADSPSPVAGS